MKSWRQRDKDFQEFKKDLIEAKQFTPIMAWSGMDGAPSEGGRKGKARARAKAKAQRANKRLRSPNVLPGDLLTCINCGHQSDEITMMDAGVFKGCPGCHMTDYSLMVYDVTHGKHGKQ